MIFHSILKLGDGAGTQEEYIEASSQQEAKIKHLEYLDNDVWDFKIISESIQPVDKLPESWRSQKPNIYGVYR